MLADTIENRCVIDIVQASLGLISEGILAIWFFVEGRTLHLRFIVQSKSEEVTEDIDDIVFELEALQAGTIDLDTETEVLVYRKGIEPPSGARIVYISKKYGA